MVTAGGAETLPFLASCGVLPASLAFFVLYGRVLDLHLQRSWVRACSGPCLASFELYSCILDHHLHRSSARGPPSGSNKLSPWRHSVAKLRRMVWVLSSNGSCPKGAGSEASRHARRGGSQGRCACGSKAACCTACSLVKVTVHLQHTMIAYDNTIHHTDVISGTNSHYQSTV